jgi:hypothetical protein
MESMEVVAIRARLAAGYGSRGLRARLLEAKADVKALLDELERCQAASEGFLEAIGLGVLRINPTPTGRRRLRELAARAAAKPTTENT